MQIVHLTKCLKSVLLHHDSFTSSKPLTSSKSLLCSNGFSSKPLLVQITSLIQTASNPNLAKSLLIQIAPPPNSSHPTESSNPDYYANQTPMGLPQPGYYNDYNDYKNFNPQQTMLPDNGSLPGGAPILTTLNGSTVDGVKPEPGTPQSGANTPQHPANLAGGQQVPTSNSQLVNSSLPVQTSPQSQNSCSSTNSLTAPTAPGAQAVAGDYIM